MSANEHPSNPDLLMARALGVCWHSSTSDRWPCTDRPLPEIHYESSLGPDEFECERRRTSRFGGECVTHDQPWPCLHWLASRSAGSEPTL